MATISMDLVEYDERIEAARLQGAKITKAIIYELRNAMSTLTTDHVNYESREAAKKKLMQILLMFEKRVVE